MTLAATSRYRLRMKSAEAWELRAALGSRQAQATSPLPNQSKSGPGWVLSLAMNPSSDTAAAPTATLALPAGA